MSMGKVILKQKQLNRYAVVDALNLAPYDSELNVDMILIMYHRGGAELAKSFLQTAESYMSEEQIAFVQQLWERK